MKFLIDTSPKQMREKFASLEIVRGQLQTPLTSYANWEGEWACDNGAFSQSEVFDPVKWLQFLGRRKAFVTECLWIAIPDVVGNARRTLEVFDFWDSRIDSEWPRALVAQDGLEDLSIDWNRIDCIFIGGTNAFKDSESAYDIVRAAKCVGTMVHVGRVNAFSRYRKFAELGADTCDGTGIVKYDHMLENLLKQKDGIDEGAWLF